MPASIKLLPRQQFVLGLSDGTEIMGQFGTYATSIFGKKRNLSLSEIYKNFLIQKKDDSGNPLIDEEGNPALDVRLHDMIDFIMCALEARARLKGERFTFTDPQLCQWVDDYYNDTGIQNVLITLYAHSVVKDEKKSELNQIPAAAN